METFLLAHTTVPFVIFFPLLNDNREVADSCTAGIVIRDTACFHCDALNYMSHSSLNHN